MKSIKQILSSHNLRTNIIFTFSVVSILLVLATARISYVFIKDLYLEQLSEQVTLFSKGLSIQFEQRYLKALSFGRLAGDSFNYFQKTLSTNVFNTSIHEAFIFDQDFVVVVHSDSSRTMGEQDHRLMLNKSEIDALDISYAAASRPFKGNDNQWYMWGFVRLTNNHWLAIRESANRLQKVEQFSNYFWLIGIGGVLLTILLSVIIAGRIVRPIEKLVRFSKSIGRGDFDTQIPVNVKGDLKVLADSLNNMRNGLVKHHKDKEQMLAKIAHEIRNPLGGIELLANLTKEDLVKENKNSTYIDKVLKEVAGLKGLINSYLQFSKPLKPVPELCNLDEIFNETISLFKNKYEEKNFTVTINSEIETVWFDKFHLRNVMINLVSNSFEAIKENGKLFIESKTHNSATLISVRDNGNGIAEQNRSEIFEPFFTTRANGTGLGLAISKKYCEENNAELIFEYEKETTFTIRIKNEHAKV